MATMMAVPVLLGSVFGIVTMFFWRIVFGGMGIAQIFLMLVTCFEGEVLVP